METTNKPADNKNCIAALVQSEIKRLQSGSEEINEWVDRARKNYEYALDCQNENKTKIEAYQRELDSLGIESEETGLLQCTN